MRTLTLTPAWIEGLRQEVLRILRTVESASTYAEATSIRQYLAAWVPAFEDRMMHLADAAQRVLAPGDRFDAEPVRAVRTLARDLAHRLLYEFDERPMGHHLAPDDFERWTFATWLRTRDASVRRLRELAQRLWRALREAHDAAAHRGATLTLTAEEPRPYRLAGFDVALVGDAQVPGAGDFVRRFERILRVLRERLDRVMPGAAALFCPIVLVWGAGYDARLMGQYFPASEVIEMYPEGLEGVRDDGVVAAVAHEGGHHLWRRVLDSAARAEWAAFVEQSLVTLDLATLRAAWETAQAMVGEPLSLLEVAQVLRAHDPRLALQVESLLNLPDAPWRPDVTLAELDAAASRTSPKVLRDPITAYARKNAQDAFCEALALLVGYGGHTLPGDVRQWLRVVVPALRTERANDLDAAVRRNGGPKARKEKPEMRMLFPTPSPTGIVLRSDSYKGDLRFADRFIDRETWTPRLIDTRVGLDDEGRLVPRLADAIRKAMDSGALPAMEVRVTTARDGYEGSIYARALVTVLRVPEVWIVAPQPDGSVAQSEAAKTIVENIVRLGGDRAALVQVVFGDDLLRQQRSDLTEVARLGTRRDVYLESSLRHVLNLPKSYEFRVLVSEGGYRVQIHHVGDPQTPTKIGEIESSSAPNDLLENAAALIQASDLGGRLIERDTGLTLTLGPGRAPKQQTFKFNHAGAAGVCSCGASTPHVIASRRTADGTQVEVWDDGAVTGGYGMALPGVPVVRPRTDDARREALAAAWMLAGDVALYDLAEVPALYATARKVAQAGGGVAEFHAALRDAQETPARAPALRLQWQTYETDATGRPTVRVAILDRMRWPGLAVWHERGRYLLMNVEYIANQRRSEPVLVPTGFTFRSQQELATHLYTHQKQAGILRTKDNSAVAQRDFWRHRTVTRTNRWGEQEETREGYSEIEPAHLTADHWQDPAVIAAKDVANRTRSWSFALRPAASDEESSLIGQSRQVGQGNFGIVYRVDTLDGPRRVKIPAPYNVHQKTWTWEEQRANLLHDVGVSNEVRALGFDVVPVQVYTEFGGTPALVGEWGEPVTELSGAEYGALEEALVAIERDHGWRVRDDLQVYRRPDGSVYVGDVGFWGAPDPQQKWTHQTTALPQLLDRLQQQTLAGLTVDPERLKGIEPGYEWVARRSVHNLPELLWRANVLADLRAESEEDGPARSKHPVMLQWNARDAQSFLDALDDRDRLGIPTPAAVRDAGTADARAVLAVTGPYVPRERTKENGRRRAEAVREALESARHAAILRRTEEPVTSLPRNLPYRCPVHFNHPHGWIYPGGWCPVCFPERTA